MNRPGDSEIITQADKIDPAGPAIDMLHGPVQGYVPSRGIGKHLV